MATYIPRRHLSDSGPPENTNTSAHIDRKEHEGQDPARNGIYLPTTTTPGQVVILQALAQSNITSKPFRSEEKTFLDSDPAEEYHALDPIEEREDENQSIKSRAAPSLHAANNEQLKHGAALEKPEPPRKDREVEQGLTLENRYQLLFSREHLEAILGDQGLSSDFARFLCVYKPDPIPMLEYYRHAVKTLRSLQYAKSIAQNLQAVEDHPFTSEDVGTTLGFTWVLQDKVNQALDVLSEALPAFISYKYMRILDLLLWDKMTGTQDMRSANLVEGLAEAFVLSDPTKEDNPIMFSSEDFHKMTGYARGEFLGKNCRSLGGAETTISSIQRFKKAVDDQREHCEALFNYRKDGCPFVNLIMCVPLRDQKGALRYYLGAQLDITPLIEICLEFSTLRDLIWREESRLGLSSEGKSTTPDTPIRDEFENLMESFDKAELQRLLEFERKKDLLPEGVFPNESADEEGRLSPEQWTELPDVHNTGQRPSKSINVYPNYLLVRRHPSLRVLFTSPNLQRDEILQRPLLSLIEGSLEILDNLQYALKVGQKVTAKVDFKFVPDQKPTPTWIHCTPLLDINAETCVWMIILVEADEALLEDAQVSGSEKPPSKRRTNSRDIPDATPWDMAEQVSAVEQVNASKLRPSSRRTYKSLSPYGVLFNQ